MTADFIRKALKARYANIKIAPEWLVLFEVRTNSGSARGVTGGERSIDAVVFNCWRSEGYKRIAFEIKVSRNDFMNEIKDPYKRLRASIYFDEFYFIAPVGIIPKNLVPPDCGLMEVDDNGNITIKNKAWHSQEYSPMPLSFLMSLLRRAYQQGIEDGIAGVGVKADELYLQAFKTLTLIDQKLMEGDTLIKPIEIMTMAKRIARRAEKLIDKESDLFPELEELNGSDDANKS